MMTTVRNKFIIQGGGKKEFEVQVLMNFCGYAGEI